MCYPSSHRLKYSNFIVNPSNYSKKIQDTLPLSLSNMLNLLLWSGPHAIINTHHPMQNLGQIWIFYKLGQTCLTQAKHDPDHPNDPRVL